MGAMTTHDRDELTPWRIQQWDNDPIHGQRLHPAATVDELVAERRASRVADMAACERQGPHGVDPAWTVES